ncbi:hypothetical protein CDAR_107191 [Caerostris darwini]|uniref:Uncharacterized protein n=1 Tax=Caerostris darwini TaxID=1538125 RepID=A0AAV4T360_9ARAC|nr:hypothetical protein CDAR_107191 [Caerostris darwini]
MCRISFNSNDGRISQITLIIKVINSFESHHDEIFQYKLVPKTQRFDGKTLQRCSPDERTQPFAENPPNGARNSSQKLNSNHAQNRIRSKPCSRTPERGQTNKEVAH